MNAPFRVPHPERLLHHEPMARYTAARLGGPAELLYVSKESTEELIAVTDSAWASSLPVRILGGGANILVSDNGVRGIVLINDVAQIEFGHWHGGINVSATGGTSLTILARKCAAQGLSGMEWAVSVPGTVGGAVVNNAGAHGGDMAQTVRGVALLDDWRGPQYLTPDELAYDYRTSALKTRRDRRFLVLMATFALTPDDPAVIQRRMDEFIAHRKRTQPPGASLGSIFKNPPGDYAGRLIEAAGLKGLKIGGAQVSPVHGNFFINTGGCTASDYYALVRQVQETVYTQSSIQLEMEVELVGEW